MTGTTVLLVLLGALSGMLVCGALCIRYLRHEMAADICPRLRRLQLQLDNLEMAVNLALATRYAELDRQSSREPAAHQLSSTNGERS